MLEEMSAFFNSRAEQYNAVHIGHIGGGIESKRIIASFLPEHTKTLLDLGIGTGLELAEIYRRFPDMKVTGVDIAGDMLDILKASYPEKSIELFRKSYFEFDFGQSRFDAALSVMSLHHYDHAKKAALYEKLRGCIKPGGVYIECDYMLSEAEYENAQQMEDSFFKEFERLKSEEAITDEREYHFDTPLTVANQIKLLLEAGFNSVDEAWRSGNTVLLVAAR